jgi:hypothetical protein
MPKCTKHLTREEKVSRFLRTSVGSKQLCGSDIYSDHTHTKRTGSSLTDTFLSYVKRCINCRSYLASNEIRRLPYTVTWRRLSRMQSQNIHDSGTTHILHKKKCGEPTHPHASEETCDRLELVKVKGKVVPLHYIEAHLGDRRYSSYSFLTSALEGGEWSPSRPGRPLPPGKEPPVPNVQEAGWAPEPVWTQRLEEKSSASVGDRTPAVQSGTILILH